MKNKMITSRNDDFAKWYTDIVKNANLCTYSGIKGFFILQPNGYAIWENIQSVLDSKFKELDHVNVSMPLIIPRSLLEKEAEHVAGFAPEVAWITRGGNNQLEEEYCIRPTSEVLFTTHYKEVVKSYRDLPKLYNQWCSVVRWEKEARPFLRSREFLWQEGHTIHESKEDAVKETLQMLEVYKNFFEEYLAIPVITGRKTEKEKFAGADFTLTVEALMYNGVALQSATSHYLGQHFTIPFDVKFLNRENTLDYAHQTSWGLSTRSIGGIIMVHADDNGLILPPKIAPKQVVIIPIGKEETVINKANEINRLLKESQIKSFIDLSEKSPGFKFAEHEMNGIPLRIEIGNRDLVNDKLTIVTRNDYQKHEFSTNENIVDIVNSLMKQMQNKMYEAALNNRNEKTYTATTYKEMEEIMNKQPGFVKAMWCGDEACELEIKKIKGTKSRCIPDEQEQISTKCVCCDKDAKHMVIWGIQY